ncbi:MAG: hypothetical protein HY580_07980 [Nitrospinae bacterium]|nr:hypothetical protein [Nitrospinota bacterium]
MKKYFKIFGWICLGIFLQFKFNMLYGIVYLENLNFHERAYFVKIHSTPTDGNLRVLHVETVVHHSLGPDYFANVYIPDRYKVINKAPYLGAEAIPGYQAYQMNMRRKYRDVLAAEDFIIAPKAPDQDIEAEPILVHFENLKQRLHDDKTYRLATKNEDTQLEGPEMVEAKYAQHIGL